MSTHAENRPCMTVMNSSARMVVTFQRRGRRGQPGPNSVDGQSRQAVRFGHSATTPRATALIPRSSEPRDDINCYHAVVSARCAPIGNICQGATLADLLGLLLFSEHCFDHGDAHFVGALVETFQLEDVHLGNVCLHGGRRRSQCG